LDAATELLPTVFRPGRTRAIRFDILDERGDADGIEALSRQQIKAHQIAQSIGQGQDFGCHTAF